VKSTGFTGSLSKEFQQDPPQKGEPVRLDSRSIEAPSLGLGHETLLEVAALFVFLIHWSPIIDPKIEQELSALSFSEVEQQSGSSDVAHTRGTLLFAQNQKG
jgi:hypothetical protein